MGMGKPCSNISYQKSTKFSFLTLTSLTQPQYGNIYVHKFNLYY